MQARPPALGQRWRGISTVQGMEELAHRLMPWVSMAYLWQLIGGRSRPNPRPVSMAHFAG